MLSKCDNTNSPTNTIAKIKKGLYYLKIVLVKQINAV